MDIWNTVPVFIAHFAIGDCAVVVAVAASPGLIHAVKGNRSILKNLFRNARLAVTAVVCGVSRASAWQVRVEDFTESSVRVASLAESRFAVGVVAAALVVRIGAVCVHLRRVVRIPDRGHSTLLALHAAIRRISQGTSACVLGEFLLAVSPGIANLAVWDWAVGVVVALWRPRWRYAHLVLTDFTVIAVKLALASVSVAGCAVKAGLLSTLTLSELMRVCAALVGTCAGVAIVAASEVVGNHAGVAVLVTCSSGAVVIEGANVAVTRSAGAADTIGVATLVLSAEQAVVAVVASIVVKVNLHKNQRVRLVRGQGEQVVWQRQGVGMERTWQLSVYSLQVTLAHSALT